MKDYGVLGLEKTCFIFSNDEFNDVDMEQGKFYRVGTVMLAVTWRCCKFYVNLTTVIIRTLSAVPTGPFRCAYAVMLLAVSHAGTSIGTRG